MNSIKTRQSGFTLVEIAIVLVIIGVLLAGVLKGQSLINNSRIKGLVNNLNAVSSGYNGYIDRYQKLPGTETLASVNLRGWTTTANGANPFAVTPANTFVNGAAGERAFWQVLKAAQFIAGNANDIVNPPSATGGELGVSVSPYGLPGVSVCVSGVTGLLAEGVDTIIDGPLPIATNIGNNVGSLQADGSLAVNPFPPGAVTPAAQAYNETTGFLWTLCRSLQ